MGTIVTSLKKSLSLFGKDKFLILFAVIPVIIGVILYSILGHWLYTDLVGSGKEWIETTISNGTWGGVISYLLVGLLTVAFFFLVNWTFVLAISLIASPFNDVISSRVERLIKEESPETIEESIKRISEKFLKIIFNEAKKIGFIIVLSLIAFGISFVPILMPVGLLIAAILMSIEFLDFSWSRHEISLKKCMVDYKRSFFVYSISGGLFLVLISIPILNLFILPYGVVYFTILFSRSRT